MVYLSLYAPLGTQIVAASSETTDTPVWALFWATVALAIATTFVAVAAWIALLSVRIAVKQQKQAQRDRHTAVFAEFGKRWDAPELVEAQQLASKLGRDGTAHVVARAYKQRGKNCLKNYLIDRADAKLAVLLRIPNYYEDLAMVVEAGGLDLRLVSKSYKRVVQDEWGFWRPAINELRKSDPYAHSQWENLYKLVSAMPEE